MPEWWALPIAFGSFFVGYCFHKLLVRIGREP